jgi:hypothetical protein
MEEITTFLDKKGREIVISGDGSEFAAKFDGKQIGRFDFDIIEMENGSIDLLTSCIISNEFQRAGIGVEMIKIAEEWFDDFHIVSHLSTEGAAFLNYCKDKQIFKFKHESYDDDRY